MQSQNKSLPTVVANTNGDTATMAENSVDKAISQIRARERDTLNALEELRGKADKELLSSLEAIRNSSLKILEKADEIEHRQQKKKSG